MGEKEKTGQSGREKLKETRIGRGTISHIPEDKDPDLTPEEERAIELSLRETSISLSAEEGKPVIIQTEGEEPKPLRLEDIEPVEMIPSQGISPEKSTDPPTINEHQTPPDGNFPPLIPPVVVHLAKANIFPPTNVTKEELEAEAEGIESTGTAKAVSNEPTFDEMIIAMGEFLESNRFVAGLKLRLYRKHADSYTVYQGGLADAWAFLHRRGDTYFNRTSLLRAIKSEPEDSVLFRFFKDFTLSGGRRGNR